MIKPAILYKDQIIKKFQERFYTDDMMYETGCNENWSPNIADCPDEFTFQYAIVDYENCIGYIGFKVDWYSSCAYNFGIMSFDKGNIVVGMALKEVMDKIINDFKVHRIEWRMVGGNPVERTYDKFCEEHNGNKYVLHDAIKDRYGKYRDSIIYEIVFDNQ